MRKSQSVRHYARQSIAFGTDDLGVLKESEESPEDTLRRQLLETERENDKLKAALVKLQNELLARPPREDVEKLEQDNKQLETMLIGSSRENERAMSEKTTALTRIKTLEGLLAKVAGPNWEQAMEVAPMTMPDPSSRAVGHQRSATMSSPIHPSRFADISVLHRQSPEPSAAIPLSATDQQAALANIEQIRMLILGIEQRFEVREEKLVKTMETAQTEAKRFEGLSQAVEEHDIS
ncbi:hypothetical protein HGRIS_008759 [Hohenbuehelia grisea]|uniref:Uncharacterized protein n=1 Tax=Hohenbuehelia grisea TaxID=104357 RepID=A0ABR3J9I1_9AGAR